MGEICWPQWERVLVPVGEVCWLKWARFVVMVRVGEVCWSPVGEVCGPGG